MLEKISAIVSSRYSLRKHQFIIISFVLALLFTFLPNNFKFQLAVTFGLIGVLYWQTKNLFLSVLTLFWFTSFFLEPGKFYSFLTIQPGVIKVEPFFSQGLVDAYGLTASDILGVALVCILLRDHFHPSVLTKLNDKKSRIRQRFIKFTLVSWLVFFLIGLYASLQMSFMPTFSVINLIQYSKVVVFFLAFTHFFKIIPRASKIMVDLLVATLGWQIVLGLAQLTTGFSTLLTNQRSFTAYTGIEDLSVVTRVSGTFLYSNEYGFFIWIFWLSLLLLTQRVKQKYIWSLGLASLVMIILTQSRTVWIIVAVTSGIFIVSYRKRIFKLIGRIYRRTKPWQAVGIVLIFFGLLAVIFQRLLTIRYSFVDGSGSVRLDMINEGWQVLQLASGGGYGVNTNTFVLHRFFPQGYVTVFPYAVHNAYLQLALEVGVVGMFAFFGPLLLAAFKLLKTRSIFTTPLSPSFIMLVILGSGLFYYILQPHGGRLELPFWGFILAIYVSLVYNTTTQRHGKNTQANTQKN